MTKKLFFVLMISSLILFFSCGSTKQNIDDTKELEPAVETEQEAQDTLDTTNQDSTNEESEQSDSAEDDTQLETEISETTDQDINELYPPLEEIEDPQLIEITPEEIEEQISAKEAEQNENQIAEPVEETEELPPLPATEDAGTSAVPEPVEGVEGLEDAEATEGQNSDEELSIEPVIEIKEEPEEIIITPSRSVSLKKGETLVITYPGSGWIYMGSTSEYNNLASRGRKLGTTDTKYTLLAKEAGTQIHHFYKIDNLTGEYIDDYIEVTVLEKKGNSSTVVNAPDYSAVVPKKPETPAKATPKPAPVQKEETEETAKTSQPATDTTTKTTTSSAAATTSTAATTSSKANQTGAKNSVTQTAPKKEEVIEVESDDAVIVIDEEETEETVDFEPILEKARTGMSSKKYDDAYTALTQYLEFATDNRDEALYLLGQLLESDSKYKDIKQAVETYQTLCDSYPASKYWDNANKRIVYLKRFYINIH